MIDPDKGLEIIQGTAQEIEIITIVETTAEVEIRVKSPGLFQGTETGKIGPEQGLDLAPL